MFEKDRPDGRKIYLQEVSVLDAARRRIRWAFDTFENVVCSISGGKDSSVLFQLAWEEAVKRNVTLNAFFLDQEAEYRSSIEQVRLMIDRPNVKAWWFQVPIGMTNATSYEEDTLLAWEPGANWVREKEPGSIQDAPDAPKRFYPFIDWFERQWTEPTCFLVGLRSEESLNRYSAVTRNPGREGINWCSKGAKAGNVTAYPLYDWAYEDIWTYLGTFGVPYNRVYDWLWVAGKSMNEMRVSNLIHEKAFKCLATLQEFEPETYERLIGRLKGVRTGALYAQEAMVYSTGKRPAAYAKWEDYRAFLIETYKGGKLEPFLARFAGQPGTEAVYRQQCRQLLLNDWENSVPVDTSQGESREKTLDKWKAIL